MPVSTPSVEFVISQIAHYMSNLKFRERTAFLKQQGMSRFLYKFRQAPSTADSMRSIRDILLQSKLWLSSPADFNDPFDMAARIIVDSTPQERRKRFDQILKRQGIGWSKRKREVQRMVIKSLAELAELAQTKFRAQIEATGICSFAGDPLSILMWSHYASNHEGVCLQFDVVKDPANLAFALPVEYNDEYPIINWIDEGFNQNVGKALLRKHSGWSYERERRIIKLQGARQSYPFRPDALTAVIIGCRANEEPILKLIGERLSMGLPHPRLYRAVQHDGKYRLTMRAMRM